MPVWSVKFFRDLRSQTPTRLGYISLASEAEVDQLAPRAFDYSRSHLYKIHSVACGNTRSMLAYMSQVSPPLFGALSGSRTWSIVPSALPSPIMPATTYAWRVCDPAVASEYPNITNGPLVRNDANCCAV